MQSLGVKEIHYVLFQEAQFFTVVIIMGPWDCNVSRVDEKKGVKKVLVFVFLLFPKRK